MSDSTVDPQSTVVPRQEPLLIEFGGFTSHVDNNYGQWSGATGRVMYRGKHIAPIFSVATQTRPEGSQATFSVDSYILINRWVYGTVGYGQSPNGSAVLWSRRRYGGTALVTVPGVSGLVATVGALTVDAEAGHYDRTLSAGAMYYRGRAIWSGQISFNRNEPGNAPSTSGVISLQYGAQKKYWVGASLAAGRIAYQTISLNPVDLSFMNYGPSVFYSKWLGSKWGFTARYEFQDEVDAYQRHGVTGSVFIEVP
jgi:YaiO family outer membrane protein